MPHLSQPELPGSSVEPSRESSLVRSIIPPLGIPTFESARYVLDMRLNRSSERNLFLENEVRVTDNPEGVAQALAATAKTLAWINFFASAEVSFRHSHEAIANGEHYGRQDYEGFPVEARTGSRFGVGENHYAVNYDESTGLELKTYSQILQNGELTPYMEEWLARILSKENRFHPSSSSLQPFAKWLRDKRPDNDFSTSYFI